MWGLFYFMSRSGSTYSVPRESNRVPFLVAASSADGVTPVVLEADPATNRLLVNSSGGGSGGTQYQELATTSPATGTLALGRYQTSLPTLTNGQMNEPMLDSSSRLLINVASGSLAVTQATAASLNATVVGTGTFAVQATGTVTANAGTGNFNTNNAQIAGTATSVGNGATDAGTQRVTLSSDSTGQVKLATGANVIGSISNTAFTANVGTTNGLALDATLTGGTQQTKITNGTNIEDVVANDSGYNGLPINNADKILTFTTSSSGAQMLLANTDVRGYAWMAVVTTSVGVGLAWNGQFAPNSGGTYIGSGTWYDETNGAATGGALGTVVNKIYSSPIVAPYFQLNVTALTSGTLSGYVILHSLPRAYHGFFATQNGTWTVGSNSATGSAFPANAFGIGAKSGANLTALLMGSQTTANSLAVALASDQAAIPVTESGTWNVGINNGLMPSGTALNTYSVHLTTNATTTPIASTAYISSIAISNEVGGTTSTVTIQDKQGTPLKLVNGIATTALTTVPTVINFQTPVKMVSGIDIITAGAVAATVDVWIDYYA